MEVVGAIASSLQIVSQCARVGMTIAKYYDAVKTVDSRIDNFVYEVNTLRTTYENLHKSLQEPSMLEAARITNKELGGLLWQQMSDTLQDCTQTVAAINGVLNRIGDNSGLFRPFVKQMKEALQTGELVRLRERVVIFNSGLQLPMQMLQLTLQLQQQQMTVDHQLQLNNQINRLRLSIDDVLSRAQQPRRSSTMGGTTLTRQTTFDSSWLDKMETYVGTAKKFLDISSRAASSISASIAQRDDESVIGLGRRGSAFAPLTQAQVRNIGNFVDELPNGHQTPAASETEHVQGTDQTSQQAIESDTDEDDEAEVDLVLIKAQLRNGLRAFEQADYASAAGSYKGALAKAQRNDFAKRVACSPADITLMLSECYIKQEKYDDAIALLEPLSELVSNRPEHNVADSSSVLSGSIRHPDKGQALSASHMLGQVYLQLDLDKAEIHALQAFKGRRKFLGKGHPKYRESVMLVIDMYKAKGLTEEAEAYRDFLVTVPEPITPETSPQIRTAQPSFVESETSVPSRPLDSRQQTRRQTFLSPFRRERNDESSRPMPLTQTRSTPAPASDGSSSATPGAEDTRRLTSTLSGSFPTSPQFMSAARSVSHNLNGSAGDNQRTGGVIDPVDAHLSPPRRSTTTSLTENATLEDRFNQVRALCSAKNYGKAADYGIELLKEYDPDQKILHVRRDDLRENIRKSKNKGLAGTGRGFSALHFFCSLKRETVEEVSILLKQEADINAVAYKPGYNRIQPITPIDLAVERGHESIVRLLLEYGATWHGVEARMPNQNINSEREVLHPLLVSVQKGWVGIVELLLRHKNVLEEENFPRYAWHGNSLLHEASFRCNIPMVEFLLQEEQKRNPTAKATYSFLGQRGQKDSFGMTPIMCAVDMREGNDQRLQAHKQQNRVECLNLLLGLGKTDGVRLSTVDAEKIAADLYLQDKRGNTVYWYADETRGGDAILTAYLDRLSSRTRLIEM